MHFPQELILTYYYPDKIFDVAENVDAKGFSIDADLLNGKADLIIKNVEMEDNMIFECRVQIRGDIDGTNSNSATLVVLGKILYIHREYLQVERLISPLKIG